MTLLKDCSDGLDVTAKTLTGGSSPSVPPSDLKNPLTLGCMASVWEALGCKAPSAWDMGTVIRRCPPGWTSSVFFTCPQCRIYFPLPAHAGLQREGGR